MPPDADEGDPAGGGSGAADAAAPEPRNGEDGEKSGEVGGLLLSIGGGLSEAYSTAGLVGRSQ